MKKYVIALAAFLLFVQCKPVTKSIKKETAEQTKKETTDFTLAFGSCNKATLENVLWDDILAQEPNVWLWGGDNIYADTADMEKLRKMYAQQDQVAGYDSLRRKIPIIGTWDDHDYGLNDGGVEFEAKKESQQEFLNFMKVPEDSPRRKQEGIYTTHDYNTTEGSIRIIILDTRYFRTSLTPDNETEKRLKPNAYGEGTILGEKQWNWLQERLQRSEADFNIIVSSYQLLSNEHGFESWGNFPHEVDRFKKTVADANAKGIMVLSGDRHISEFSVTKVDGLENPLVDFTSSGLTHAYNRFKGEPNPYRVGKVVFTESFGVLQFNFQQQKVSFKIIGDAGVVLEKLEQEYSY